MIQGYTPYCDDVLSCEAAAEDCAIWHAESNECHAPEKGKYGKQDILSLRSTPAALIVYNTIVMCDLL